MLKTYTSAILLLTDKHSDMVKIQYLTLKRASKNRADLFIAYHQKEESVPPLIKNASNFVFTDEILTELAYKPIRQSLIPGSNHFPLLKFYLQNPFYEYYWVIEDDVRFNGDWDFFFETVFSLKNDFISCYVNTWNSEPLWPWWNIWHPSKIIPLESRLKSFNPIYRISNLALNFMHRSLSDNWYGHHEVILPTLLNDGGFKIADFGGEGPYVPEGFTNRLYINQGITEEGYYCEGTMRYRPIFSTQGNEPDKLYHPVKDIT